MVTLHKIVHGGLDSNLMDYVSLRANNKRTRNLELFALPMVSNNNVSNNAPVFRMCRVYNNLDIDLDILNVSLPKFKNVLLSQNCK